MSPKPYGNGKDDPFPDGIGLLTIMTDHDATKALNEPKLNGKIKPKGRLTPLMFLTRGF